MSYFFNFQSWQFCFLHYQNIFLTYFSLFMPCGISICSLGRKLWFVKHLHFVVFFWAICGGQCLKLGHSWNNRCMRSDGEAYYFGNARAQGRYTTVKTHCSFLLIFFSLWYIVGINQGLVRYHGGKKNHGCYENGMFTFVGILFFETPTWFLHSIKVFANTLWKNE